MSTDVINATNLPEVIERTNKEIYKESSVYFLNLYTLLCEIIEDSNSKLCKKLLKTVSLNKNTYIHTIRSNKKDSKHWNNQKLVSNLENNINTRYPYIRVSFSFEKIYIPLNFFTSSFEYYIVMKITIVG